MFTLLKTKVSIDKILPEVDIVSKDMHIFIIELYAYV